MHPCVVERVFRYGIMTREAQELWKGRRVYLVPDATLPRDGLAVESSDAKVLTLPADARLVQ